MKRRLQRAGFTLFELVLSIVLVAILSTAFFPMVRMSQQRSAQMLLKTRQMHVLQNQMEIIIAAYASEISDGGDIKSFRPRVHSLLRPGIELEQNDFVKEDGGALIPDTGSDPKLLLISIRDESGIRLRRLFGAK